jgi:hypothetical protein
MVSRERLERRVDGEKKRRKGERTSDFRNGQWGSGREAREKVT